MTELPRCRLVQPRVFVGATAAVGDRLPDLHLPQLVGLVLATITVEWCFQDITSRTRGPSAD